MPFNPQLLVDGACKVGASDIHIVQDTEVFLRVDGVIRPVKDAVVSHGEIVRFLEQIMPENAREVLDVRRNVDFAWQPDDRVRFRISTYYERGRLRLVMRLIRMEIMGLDDLGMPEVLHKIATWERGMVIVTGVTGSGKSTTLAAIIKQINTNERRCIITIEDPIEMVHPNVKSLISQREVGRDVESFRAGLVQALRQDPDVILIGEMRDPETISTALRAAETGHYVFSTMHTTNALHTVERILSEFPQSEHELIRDQLANNLRATVTQRLVKRAEGKGRCAALEVMVVNDVISKLLLDDMIPSIATAIRERREGMMLFDQHLADLTRDGTIAEQEAYRYVEDEAAFRRYLKGRLSSADKGGILG